MAKQYVDQRRVYQLKGGKPLKGPVIYWMSRDQRAVDNWGLLFAQQLAVERGQALAVVFCLAPAFLGAAKRQYDFMLKGLAETETALKTANIPFHLIFGAPEKELPEFLKKSGAAALVTDFDPLRIKRKWKERVSKVFKAPFYEVDGHNIVPCRQASRKQEYAAYTIRPRINGAVGEYLTEFPKLLKHPFNKKPPKSRVSAKKALESLNLGSKVPPVSWIVPGAKSAERMLSEFINTRLGRYNTDKNDPSVNGLSNLSPYIHFGQLSAQRVCLEIIKSGAPHGAVDSFIEELVVRRELADNFCFYNDKYDAIGGLPEWAQRTLKKHSKDKRRYIYGLQRLESAATHDDAWNASQSQMVRTGKMHGYMRMYWAKKILEWSKTPEDALKTAVYLNDKYELDGRDPNGYTGILWSIGGLHDRPWFERPVFGQVRYMSYNGLLSKFDLASYIKQNEEKKRRSKK